MALPLLAASVGQIWPELVVPRLESSSSSGAGHQIGGVQVDIDIVLFMAGIEHDLAALAAIERDGEEAIAMVGKLAIEPQAHLAADEMGAVRDGKTQFGLIGETREADPLVLARTRDEEAGGIGRGGIGDGVALKGGDLLAGLA